MGNVTKNIILDKNGVKLPFSKEKLSIAPTFDDPCQSKDFKGVADIPDEWACCEGETMPNWYNAYSIKLWSKDCNLCLRCVYKWTKFDFDPSLDYKLVKKEEEKPETEKKGARAIQTIAEEIEMYQKTEDGLEIFVELQKKFLEEHVKPNISF